MRHLEASESQRQKEGCWFPGAEGRRNGECMCSWDRVSVGEAEKVLELDGSNGGTTV